MRRLQLSRAVWVVTPLCFGPAVVHAQADSGAPASAELITQARAQLRARQLDSAAVLLRRVTDAPARSPAARVPARVLLGIANLYSSRCRRSWIKTAWLSRKPCASSPAPPSA